MKEFKSVFERGEVNPFGKYFEGTSYLKMLSTEGVSVGNVIFEPGCINHWHVDVKLKMYKFDEIKMLNFV